MYMSIQEMKGAYRECEGLTVGHRGCVQGRTGYDRVYKGSVQWHTGGVQGMTVKTQGKTGDFNTDKGF